MKQTELLKGILEGLVLAIIQRKETYGYEITKILNDQGFTEIVEGTVYTILLRLEKNQWVIAEKAFRKRTNAEVLSLNLIRRSRTR